MAVDWSSLPLDLIFSIGSKLEKFEDFYSLSAVCRTWNYGSSLLKHRWKAIQTVPWLLVAENTDDSNCVWKLLNIRNNKRYELNLPQMFGKMCWSSPYGWIAMLDREFNVELFNPITRARISFPSLKAIDEFEKLVNKHDESEEFQKFMNDILRKVIVLKVSQGDCHEFVIIVLFKRRWHLPFAGHGDQKWTLSSITDKLVVDVVVMGDNVFALCRDGSVVYWNVKEFYSRQTVKPIEYCPRGVPKHLEVHYIYAGEIEIHLVQSGCDLLMVQRYKEYCVPFSLCYDSDSSNGSDLDDDSTRTTHFVVFKLDHKNKIWEETRDDIDNARLFVGDKYSMSVSSDCLKGNCIYFTENEAKRRSSDNYECVVQIYDDRQIKKWQLDDDNDDDHLCFSLHPLEWFVPQF